MRHAMPSLAITLVLLTLMSRLQYLSVNVTEIVASFAANYKNFQRVKIVPHDGLPLLTASSLLCIG